MIVKRKLILKIEEFKHKYTFDRILIIANETRFELPV